MPYKPEVVISKIKSVWKPGMSSRDITAALDIKLSKGTVTTYFRKWKVELEPCYLPAPTRPQKFTPIIEPPIYGETYVNQNGITLPKVFRD